ncbi:Uncharacterised protein [Mycobacterium tuberculosis]|nr:Uncharacterised protein [Mycobacterium tuberculosis]
MNGNIRIQNPEHSDQVRNASSSSGTKNPVLCMSSVGANRASSMAWSRRRNRLPVAASTRNSKRSKRFSSSDGKNNSYITG